MLGICLLFLLPSVVEALPHVQNSTFEDKTGLSTGHQTPLQVSDYIRNDAANLKNEVSEVRDVIGSKPVPAAVMVNPKVQEAAVEKGIEVAGKLVDKQLQTIDGAQRKAADFLKKEIKLDITPDKGWESEDMFLPPGYHIDASISGGEESPKEGGETPYVFPAGLGTALMNGCWGSGYKETDPCYSAKWKSSICQNMIDGAAFMGVGFDGRGKYSPESRKISIVQRNCANKATYDGLDVPDTMNVHGIYDTSASLMTFESREEYRKHIQQQAGVSGSYYGFSAGVKEAWGESTATARQKYLAMMDVDVDRYEIFLDEVKPQDLSMSFLREFMNLPTSYFSAGGPLKYQNFIQRWGTHFVKSAKFGGQLEIRKTMDAEEAKSRKEFEIQMEMEFKNLFASVGAGASFETGESSRKQTKTTSTSVVAQGGSQHIASILSDVYSPTFKTEFKEWLKTIPDYPKAFRFQIGSITDLLDFRANDLFQDDSVDWGCEGNAAHLQTEEKGGETIKYYEVEDDHGTRRYYCEFDSRQAVENAVQRRRLSLKRAIEIYMEEGAMSISDIELNACTPHSDQTFKDNHQSPFLTTREPLSWADIIKDSTVLKVSFDMVDDLPNAQRSTFNIGRNMTRLVKFYEKKWYTSDNDGSFHLYGAYGNRNTNNVSLRKISIFGLVLTFNEVDNSLVLDPSDFKVSKRFFPTLAEDMVGTQLARVYISSTSSDKRSTSRQPSRAIQLCQEKWSNALRFDPTDTEGKCLHFTASTAGTLFVIFAALPKEPESRYLVEISPEGVYIYKGTILKKSTTNANARALGYASLYQSYFVCITESEESTLIEYGKSLGTSESGDIYLIFVDSRDHLNARFYAFGNDQNPAKVMDVHIGSRHLTKAECKGKTVKDLETNLCVQKCHKDCDPLAGCELPDSAQFPNGCKACRTALDVERNKCIPACPDNKMLTKDKKCVPTFDVKGTLVFENLPFLPEVTICHWMKLDKNFVRRPGYFHKFHGGSRSSILSFIQPLGDGGIFFRMEISPDGKKPADRQRLNLSQLEDLHWHQFCVTWSGFTGVIQYYFDGKNILSAINRQRGELQGGGSLAVGDTRMRITGFDVWDRVLTRQEIAQNLKKCDAGKGNVVQWHQAFKYFRKNKKMYSIPSACEPLSSN